MSGIEDFGKRLLEVGFDRWHSRTGLAIVAAGIIVSGVAIFAGINIANITTVEWVLIGSAVLIVCGLWWKTSIERVSKNRVGFGVAVEFENTDQAKELRSDFIITLRNLLNGSHHRHRFQFIEFPQSLAKRINSEEEARWLARKSGVHFLIHGRARLRATPKGQSHVLDLSWLVRHGTITIEESQKFASDAGTVFPGRVIIEPHGDLFVCEFAARHVDAVAGYVIGTAAALSGDFQYAEQLLLDSESKMAQFVKQAEGAPLSVLLNRVRKRIAEVYLLWMGHLSRRFALKREEAALQEAAVIARKLRKYIPDSYAAHLTAAMAAFLLRRDVPEARRELDACRKENDATWMYSEAFLVAYAGDLEQAYRLYRRAFESPLSDPTIPMQCEEFIQIVVDKEPERSWLYYCLGLINYRAKGDLEAARADFKRFVEGVDAARFKKQIEVAEVWIREIEAVLTE